MWVKPSTQQIFHQGEETALRLNSARLGPDAVGFYLYLFHPFHIHASTSRDSVRPQVIYTTLD